MNASESEIRLKRERDLSVPTSTAPNMESLQQKVGQVRRCRLIARTLMATVTILLCAIGSVALFQSTNRAIISNDQAIAAANSAHETETLGTETLGTETLGTETLDTEIARAESNDRASVATKTDSDSKTARTPKIQLYARVHGAVPVFDIDTKTKTLQHVGWTASEQKVPVDMRYVPASQQETFNAVLSGDRRDDWSLSL